MTDQSAFRQSGETGYVVLAPNPTGALTLACFHYAGGSAQTFFSWRKECSKCCELVTLELPGRGRRQKMPFVNSIVEAAQQFALAFRRQGQRDLVFYGHSLGALLAFETARVLKAEGGPIPSRLIVSSRAAPGSPQSTASLPKLSDADLLRYLEALQGTPRAVLENTALMKLMLPVLRADLQLVYDYQLGAGPRLDIPVDVIGALDDALAPIECLLEWRVLTNAEFRLRMIPGGHFAPVSSPDEVLRILDEHRSSAGMMEFGLKSGSTHSPAALSL